MIVTKIKNGRFTDEALVDRFLQSHEDKFVEISIQKKNRSNSQNKYLWSVIYNLISEYTGYTQEEIHELCKSKFLKSNIEILNKETGELLEFETVQTTTRLDTVEFENYTKSIREWASHDLNLYIPLPNEK